MLKKVFCLTIIFFISFIPFCEAVDVRETAKTVIKGPVFILTLPIDALLYVILALLHLSSYLFSFLMFLVNTFVSYIPEKLIDAYSDNAKEFVEGARNWDKVIAWYFPYLYPLKPIYESYNSLSQMLMSLPFVGIIFSILPLIFRFVGGMINVLT